MTEYYEFVKAIHHINKEDYQLLAEKFNTRHFKKREHLVMPGQTEKEMFFIKSGVLMYNFEVNGKVNVLGFAYLPSFCFIPESFMLQKPSKYYLTCLTNSELECITFSDLQKLFDQSQPIERLFRKLSDSVIIGLINRQIELRSTSIEERFKAFCQRSPHLLQLVPHKYIASYLSIDSTNFSKLFNSVRF